MLVSVDLPFLNELNHYFFLLNAFLELEHKPTNLVDLNLVISLNMLYMRILDEKKPFYCRLSEDFYVRVF